MSMNITGTIFNIQRFSVHDGPGIRTVVFLKGCPLRCKWCANPESQNTKPELAWTCSKCIGCAGCARAGLKSNLHFEGETLFWDELLDDLAVIERTCPSRALHVIGYRALVKDVLKEVNKDSIFYGDEEGGLTVSGGEPLMQPEFTYELLKSARDEGINTSIETTGFGKTEDFLKIAEQLDYMLMDIKSMDDEVHKLWTGVSNKLILENFRAVREAFPELIIHVRTPVIPGVNDSEEAIKEIHDFLMNFDNVRYELLKYHRLGESKYESLHRAYPMGDRKLDDEAFEKLKKFQIAFSEDKEWQKGAGI